MYSHGASKPRYPTKKRFGLSDLHDRFRGLIVVLAHLGGIAEAVHDNLHLVTVDEERRGDRLTAEAPEALVVALRRMYDALSPRFALPRFRDTL